MKKISLSQWILMAGALTLSFSCQSKKPDQPKMEMEMESDTQCEEDDDGQCIESNGSGYGDDSEAGEEADPDQMSSIPQVETQEKVSVEPIQAIEVTPVAQPLEASPTETQIEVAPSPTVTESAAPEQLSMSSIPELEFIAEVDLDTLGKLFSIETEEVAETKTAPTVVGAE